MGGDESSAAASQAAVQGGLDKIFREEAPRLARFFRFRTSNGTDPFDLVQEAFTRFLGRMDKSVPDNPVAYLNRIARNLLYEQSRSQKRRQQHETGLDPATDIATAPAQSDYLEASQMMEKFHRSLDQLPPRLREVFLLHRTEELSYKQIAERLDISVGTVEQYMVQALFRLRRMMIDE